VNDDDVRALSGFSLIEDGCLTEARPSESSHAIDCAALLTLDPIQTYGVPPGSVTFGTPDLRRSATIASEEQEGGT
jgi:hypothetical protein